MGYILYIIRVQYSEEFFYYIIKNPQIMIINTIYYIYNNILYIYTFIHSSAPGMNEQFLVSTRTYSFIPPPRGLA